MILDNLSANKIPQITAWATRNKVELCLTPTYASWANPIEAQFGPLRIFVMGNSTTTCCHRGWNRSTCPSRTLPGVSPNLVHVRGYRTSGPRSPHQSWLRDEPSQRPRLPPCRDGSAGSFRTTRPRRPCQDRTAGADRRADRATRAPPATISTGSPSPAGRSWRSPNPTARPSIDTLLPTYQDIPTVFTRSDRALRAKDLCEGRRPRSLVSTVMFTAMGRSRPPRRLLVGSLTYQWRAGHRHERYQDQGGLPQHDDCREVLTLRRAGAPGRLVIVFRRGPGRLVNDGMFHDGGVLRTSDRAYLNLHRPGVVRALLDEALDRGHDFATAGTAEIDGWGLIDGVLRRLRPSDQPLPQPDRNL